MKPKPYITSYDEEQVWFTGKAWYVSDGTDTLYEPGLFWQYTVARFRCRVWGLLHGHGWLGVKK